MLGECWGQTGVSSKDPADQWIGQVGSQCLWQETYRSPDQSLCSFQFKAIHYSPKIDEVYLLSYNDPIHVFVFDSKYKISDKEEQNYQFYYRPPVLGGMRDRFVDHKPVSDSLLFTTVLLGGGVMWDFWKSQLATDISYLYIKQRYTTLVLDEEEEQAQQLYAFDQAAVSSRLQMITDWNEQITSEIGIYLLTLQYDEIFQDLERSLDVQWFLMSREGYRLGMSFGYYKREHNLRKDQQLETYQLAKIGAMIEF